MSKDGIASENRRTRRTRAMRRRLFWTGTLVLILGLFAYGILATDLLVGAGSGEPAPDVTLKTASGDLRLSEQRGKVVVLYFSFPG